MLKDLLSLIGWFFSKLITRLVILLFLAAGFMVYYKYRDSRRQESPAYVKGIITHRFDKQQKSYFQYQIQVRGKTYTNSAGRQLCSECKDISCIVGDSLLVEYRRNNPSNNAPVCTR